MMNLRIAGILLVSVVLLISATACQNPATGKPEAEVAEPAADKTAAAPMVEGREFGFSGESTIGFTGSKVTGSHDGGFLAFDGTVILAERGPASSRVEVAIDTTSLWSDNDKLTTHLKSPDFFDVENHPTARFVSTSITASEAGYSVSGELELHGVIKQITFPATITVEQERIEIDAEFFIKRYDFNVEYPGKPDDLIRDEVVIRLNLVAVPGESAAG